MERGNDIICSNSKSDIGQMLYVKQHFYLHVILWETPKLVIIAANIPGLFIKSEPVDL